MSVITAIKSAVKKLPGVRDVISDRDKLYSELIALKRYFGFVPPGHFYSPIPSIEDILRDESKIFGPVPPDILGVDLHESDQLRLLEEFRQFYSEMPFQPQKTVGLRYYFENPAYTYSDAIFLHCMIRYLRPKRIIEVGSGFSSCVTLDTNELFFGNSIATTFIEPYPDPLMSLLKETDNDNIRIISCRLQDADIADFEELGKNDILFVDSTHVSKVNSDLNRIFFDILPRLALGVHIHFHDVFYPFEYPKEWIMEGKAWNEAYMLRTFLQYNKSFEVVMMNSFMEYAHESFFREKMPLCLKNTGGSIWIRKTSN
jgi:hypothetical protein